MLDALGRTTGQVYLDGTRATFTLDAAGEQTTMQDVTGVTTLLWDNEGRQVGVMNGAGKALSFTLDPAGNRSVLLDSDGGLTTYTHDEQNRLTGIVNPYNEFTTIQHDALDREVKKTLGNGMIVSQLYDAAGRELALWNVGPTGVGLAIYTASYDPVGNRLNNIELDGTRVTWAYDPSNQLINEKRSGTNSYNTTYLYDPVGNRAVKNDSGALTSYSYNPANELTLMQPPTGQPTTSLWDANGNLAVENAGGSITTNSWDGENRLIGVAYSSGAPDSMTYSAEGLRQKKVTGSGTTGFVWDEQNLLLETDGSGVTQAHYTAYPGYWGGLQSRRRSGASSFYGFDPQANDRILASGAGGISDSYLYKAFGEELAISGSTVNPFRFGALVQYYRDLANRLDVRARVLQPDLGRWMSRDPVGRHGYGYADNAPTGRVDPGGRRSPIVPLSRGSCFWGWYNFYTSRGEDPTAACKQANRRCGTKLKCPPYPPPPRWTPWVCKAKKPDIPDCTPPILKALAAEHWCKTCQTECEIHCDADYEGGVYNEKCHAGCTRAYQMCMITLNFEYTSPM